MGNSSGKRFPVRASDTRPPRPWPFLPAKASSMRHLSCWSQNLPNSPYITDDTSRESLVTVVITVATRFPPGHGYTDGAQFQPPILAVVTLTPVDISFNLD